MGTVCTLCLEYTTDERGFAAGGNLWVFYDIRQFRSAAQHLLAEGGVTVAAPPGSAWEGRPLRGARRCIRTLDLYPQVPEFLHAAHVRCVSGSLAPGQTLGIVLRSEPGGFRLPEHAIDAFTFWLVEDPAGILSFQQGPDDRYFFFQPRAVIPSPLASNPLTIESGPATGMQVVCPSLSTGQARVCIHFEDAFGNPAPFTGQLDAASSGERQVVDLLDRTQAEVTLQVTGPTDTVQVTAGRLAGASNPVRVTKTALPLQLYWGDLHGMMFNQRPFADYFRWARDVARLDFAGGQLFSYNVCVAAVWEALLAVWREFDQPGTFVALPSVEHGTPPDGSHRHAFFREVPDWPPLFCEDRPAAHDPLLQARFHPQTVDCADYRALYTAVRARGGLLHGHYHTRFYEGETLAEIYQKQVFDGEAEERKINEALHHGLRLGIVAGSDTHDSRPGNRWPEPGPVRPAGLTGVWAERLDRAAIFDALARRRCYATTGVRILVDFRIDGVLMGGTVRPGSHIAAHELAAEVVGGAPVSRIELVVNGEVARTYTPGERHVRLVKTWPSPPPGSSTVATGGAQGSAPPRLHYAYLRVTQADGHRAWTSPIWLP